MRSSRVSPPGVEEDLSFMGHGVWRKGRGGRKALLDIAGRPANSARPFQTLL